MTKVGADKRLSYYQLTADEVIAELRSHRYGLTQPEAKRRLKQNGANLIKSTDERAKRIHSVLQPWLLTMLALGAVGAWYADSELLAITLVLLALLGMLSDIWRERSRDNLQYHVHKLLPVRATVRRNDLDQVIDAGELVIGDIVVLQTGMQVPADLRILESDKLLGDGTMLGSGHNHAFVHAIESDLPLSQQHNIFLSGTSIVSGSGLGVVIATGMQTELGKIVAQADVTKTKSSLFQRSFYQLTRRFAWISAMLLVVLSLVVAKSSLEFRDGAAYGLAVLISVLPLSIAIAAIRMFGVFGRQSRQQGAFVRSNSLADRLGGVDTLLLDEDSFLIEPTVVAMEFVVGQNHYTSSTSQLSPTADLLNKSGKKLTKKALADLELFFDALALGTHARLLPPDGDHSEWHSAGPSSEAALVALAAQAGVQAEDARKQHVLLDHNTFDYHRQLSSTVHQYNHRQLAFIHGASARVLPRADRIWDGGHTRKLTATDRKKFEAYQTTQAHLGNHVIAIAYSQITQKTNANVEHGLTILGFVSIGQPVKKSAKRALKGLRSAGIAVSIISNRAVAVANGTAEQLGITTPTAYSTHELLQLSDSQLLQLLTKGGAIFTQLTPEQRLRLVAVAERAKRHVAVCGTSLADIPAMRQASVGICVVNSGGVASEEADIALENDDLGSFNRAFNKSRSISAHLQRIMHSTLADHSIQLWLVLFGFGLYYTDKIPLATTATLLLVATLMHSLAFAAIGEDVNGRRETPVALAPHSSLINVWLGLLGALLVCTNFVYFFVRAGLSPSYIDSASNLYLQAATLGFVTLLLCMWVNLLFARAQHTTSLLSHQLRNKTLLQVSGLHVLMLLALVYNTPIQNIVGTRSLSFVDWLCAVIAASAYFAIRMLAHHERKRSRRTVIGLHHKIHGKTTGSKI